MSKYPFQIVVGYDFSETSQVTLTRAIDLVSHEPQHMLHVLAVLDNRGGLGPFSRNKTEYSDALEIHELLTKELQSRIQDLGPGHPVHFCAHVRIGDAAEQILELAREVGAHMILVGSHGHTGLRRLLLGSVSEKVVREARCPVFVAREREYEDAELATIVDKPAKQADEQPYVQPHRYTYDSGMVLRRDMAWPWY